MAYFKYQLLKDAASRGLGEGLDSARLLFQQQFLFETILVFRAPASELLKVPSSAVPGLSIKPYRAWDALEPDIRKTIESDPHEFWWNSAEWFAAGWIMWAGFLNGEFCGFCWTRNAEQSADWFAQLKPDEALIWQSVTLDQYRGRGVFKGMLSLLNRELLSQGYAALYISCAEYNKASRRAIERSGFRRCGIARRWRLGTWRWFPDRVSRLATSNS